VQLLLLAFLWGVHWPVTKIGLRSIHPFTYAALRVAVALVAVAAVLAWRGQLRLPHRRDLSVVGSVGLGQMAASIALMNLALLVVSAGRSSVLLFTQPLWVALLELPAVGLRNARGQIVGLVLGLSGIGLLLNPTAINWGSTGQLLGSGALIMAAVINAAVTIHLRRHDWRGSPFLLEPWQLVSALVPLVLLAAIFEGSDAIRPDPVAFLVVLYSGLMATAVSYWLSQSISRALNPLTVTMGMLGVPVVGLISSALILGEPLTPVDVAGVLVTFAGIVAVSLASARSSGTTEARTVPSASDTGPRPGTDAGILA
jgi:drug/metabolite transporter (DMT)-like permease